MYNEHDVKWIKSITRGGGTDWAYMEYGLGDVFELRFPDNARWYPTNYQRPRPNDLIVLFQTLTEAAGAPGGTYVTHLVTPVDTMVEMDDSPHHPYKRYVCVVGRTDPVHRVDLTVWSFYKPNRGQICPIVRIERRGAPDCTMEEKQSFVWGLFNNRDTSLDEEICRLVAAVSMEEEWPEEGGERIFLKLHKIKERDRGIVAQAKARAREAGHFYCEVCDFNFETNFPVLGNGFIECHHKLPIATGGVRRTLESDLALVCSNCHRMLHRKMDGTYLSVEQLRQMVGARRSV